MRAEVKKPKAADNSQGRDCAVLGAGVWRRPVQNEAFSSPYLAGLARKFAEGRPIV